MTGATIAGYRLDRTRAWCYQCEKSPDIFDIQNIDVGFHILVQCHGEYARKILSNALFNGDRNLVDEALIFFRPNYFKYSKADPVVVRVRQILRRSRRG